MLCYIYGSIINRVSRIAAMLTDILPGIISAVVISGLSTFIALQINAAKSTERLNAHREKSDAKDADHDAAIVELRAAVRASELQRQSLTDNLGTTAASLHRAWDRIDDHSTSIEEFGRQFAIINEQLKQLRETTEGMPLVLAKIAAKLDIHI